MAHRFLISQDSPALYITIVTKDRLPVFRTDALKQILCRALDEARASARILLFGYVIMIDHLHLLTNRPSTTSDVLQVLKGLSARRVIDYVKENCPLSSLAKLQHQEPSGSTNIHFGKRKRMSFLFLVKECSWKRFTTSPKSGA